MELLSRSFCVVGIADVDIYKMKGWRGSTLANLLLVKSKFVNEDLLTIGPALAIVL